MLNIKRPRWQDAAFAFAICATLIAILDNEVFAQCAVTSIRVAATQICSGESIEISWQGNGTGTVSIDLVDSDGTVCRNLASAINNPPGTGVRFVQLFPWCQNPVRIRVKCDGELPVDSNYSLPLVIMTPSIWYRDADHDGFGNPID